MIFINGRAGERKTSFIGGMTVNTLDSLLIGFGLGGTSVTGRKTLAKIMPWASNCGLINLKKMDEQQIVEPETVERFFWGGAAGDWPDSFNGKLLTKKEYNWSLKHEHFFMFDRRMVVSSRVCKTVQDGPATYYASWYLNGRRKDHEVLVKWHFDDPDREVCCIDNVWFSEDFIEEPLESVYGCCSVVLEGLSSFPSLFLYAKIVERKEQADMLDKATTDKINMVSIKLLDNFYDLWKDKDIAACLVTLSEEQITAMIPDKKILEETLKLSREIKQIVAGKMASRSIEMVTVQDVAVEKSTDTFDAGSVRYSGSPESLWFKIIQSGLMVDSMLPLAFSGRGTAVAGGISSAALLVCSETTYHDHFVTFPEDSFLGESSKWEPLLSGNFTPLPTLADCSSAYITIRKTWRNVKHQIFHRTFTPDYDVRIIRPVVGMGIYVMAVPKSEGTLKSWVIPGAQEGHFLLNQDGAENFNSEKILSYAGLLS